MDASIDEISNDVLESGFAVLTGGYDIDGHPIICFPPDRTSELQQCSTGDLRLLLQYYVRISSPKISVLVNMKEGWTESGIMKIITALDELQSDRRGTIASVCILKPEEKSKLRVLKRSLLRKDTNGRILPFYKVHLLASEEEFFNFIDKSQLTMDFGGTLQYNHEAWVDFQKSFSTLLTAAITLKNKVKSIKTHAMKLRENEDKDKLSDDIVYRQKEIRAKYESVLEQNSFRQTVTKCQDGLERLDNPDDDSVLIQVHCNLIIDTKNKLKDALDDIKPELEEMDSAMTAFEDEMGILAKLQECRKNTEEVKETIGLLTSQIHKSALVGRDLKEAANFRGYFAVTALEPSKDIVACATSILKNLDGGNKTTQRTYNIAFDIAKQLTQSIQPFTKLMNELNDEYTRIHVVHAVFEKMVRWKSKASIFIVRQLVPVLNNKMTSYSKVSDFLKTKDLKFDKEPDYNKPKTVTFKTDFTKNDNGQPMTEDNNREFDSLMSMMKTANKSVVRDLNENDRLCRSDDDFCSRRSSQQEEMRLGKVSKQYLYKRTCQTSSNKERVKENDKLEYDTFKLIQIEAPSNWKLQLRQFYRKHPAPKKKHIKLLTKYAKMDGHPKLKSRANTLAERTLFILSFLKKKMFKSEEVIRIQQWEEDDNTENANSQKRGTNNETCILEVTLV